MPKNVKVGCSMRCVSATVAFCVLHLINASYANNKIRLLATRRVNHQFDAIASRRAKSNKCFWQFVKYHPSPWEIAWRADAVNLDGLPGTPLCDLLHSKYKSELQTYKSYSNMLAPDSPTLGKAVQCPISGNTLPVQLDDSIFSKFEYRYRCGSHVGDRVQYAYIEPLVGLLRHPDTCTGRWADKNYMVIDPWPLLKNQKSSTVRTYFFDAGASLWDSGDGGPSQSWFYNVYKNNCLNFTDMFAWEKTPQDPYVVFDKIPGHLKPGYRWFNIPLSTKEGDWDNPLQHILNRAHREDVVILKVDFDSPLVEDALIQTILNNQTVSDLIDELYFEHHVNQEVMRDIWTMALPLESLRGYHTDSLNLFTALRRKGIRAHSWV